MFIRDVKPRQVRCTVYVADYEGEICFHLYSDQEIQESGLEPIETELRNEHTWVEKLGQINGSLDNRGRIAFFGRDLERLLPLCSRKLVPIEGTLDFEYRATEWGPAN